MPHHLWVERYKKKLDNKSFPSDYLDTLQQAYFHVKQGILSLEDYTDKFNEYILRCHIRVNDCLTINC